MKSNDKQVKKEATEVLKDYMKLVEKFNHGSTNKIKI